MKEIHEDDGLSDRVCTSCIENLSTAYLFKLQCERIDNLMRKFPDIQIDKPDDKRDYNDLYNQEFHMHTEYIKEENDDNLVKSAQVERDRAQLSPCFETSDETDSDIDSIKCVYCNESYSNYGAHTCHVTCTIEHNQLQRSSSNETLVATDFTPTKISKPLSPIPDIPEYVNVSCVLCDQMFDQFDHYVTHLNKCTTNVKLHHFVCPVCHEMFTDKGSYLEHLKLLHFKTHNETLSDTGTDCVDFAPMIVKTSKPKAVRRQIGWSIEDIYQEIECQKIEQKPTATSSPLKNFFSKLGNESSSRQSTPKKVSFRKFIENGKAKTSVYLPFKKYIQNYKLKKKANNYSPINTKAQVTSRIQAIFPEEISDSDYNSPSGASEDSWKMKQNLICACDKKVFMLSEHIHDRDRIVAMINELGGVVAENTKMEMLATHFVSVLPSDTFSGMMVCALATGKWLLHISFVYDSFRCKKFLQVSFRRVYWNSCYAAFTAWAVPINEVRIYLYYVLMCTCQNYYHPKFKKKTPGSCCSADYCFVDMKIIERVKLRFFFHHNVPVFPYQYILVYLLKRGRVDDEHKYLLQDCTKVNDKNFFLNNTY
ncbi:jg12834 [Pararge aegeria aegeria]|uniref:Jg12834 protein n=1 Tax=Pararge aegeria aegeria TaxID=348720 RepID=A0A8S4RLG8_9NEOP|nr:jg12834 [Pararge aegeria aegeria]